MTEKKYHDAAGRPGRIVAARVLPGADLVESIIELIQKHRITTGTVTAVGSLNSAQVIWAKTTDLSQGFSNIAVRYTMEGPVELGIGWGVFGFDEETGAPILHFHGLIMDKEGGFRCGNLQPGSAPVMATVDLTIQEIEGMAIRPDLDPVFNHKFLKPGPA
jgi:hypothetical protein